MTNISYHSLTKEARALIKLLDDDPTLMVNLSPPREMTVLAKKPKVGEKIHNGKQKYNRSIDFSAAELKTDLILALQANDYNEIASCFYTLAHLIGYL